MQHNVKIDSRGEIFMKQILLKAFLWLMWIVAFGVFLILGFYPPQLFKDIFPLVFIPYNEFQGSIFLKLISTLEFITIISMPLLSVFWLTFYSSLWEKIFNEHILKR